MLDSGQRNTAHPTMRWDGNERGTLFLLDQTQLPTRIEEVRCIDVETVWEAIRSLRVRGAPAIGVAAAYGVVVGMQTAVADDFSHRLAQVTDYLASSRPTAVNLFWALDRMRASDAKHSHEQPSQRLRNLLHEARQIHHEDRDMCDQIGSFGAPLLASATGVLTHCNAGALATAGEGTALSVIFAAARKNPDLVVYADETRPLLQGARLTAWELQQRNIPVTLICDSVAGWAMQQGRIQAVVTGADRIAANGDAANKIGTYSVAQLARAHGIPFYIAAPSSTFDLELASGNLIPIEQRDQSEVTHGFGCSTAPEGVDCFNPAFDVTPAHLIHSLITERGIIHPVTEQQILTVLQK